MKKLFLLLTATVFLVSCGGASQPVDIINPDAEYRYFFGGTCPHCQELNRIAEERDLYSKISIEKREVYANQENRQMFLDLIDELGTDESGVPFVYDTVTGKIAVGVRPALELMTSRLGQSTPTTQETQTQETQLQQDTQQTEETQTMQEDDGANSDETNASGTLEISPDISVETEGTVSSSIQ